MAAGRVENVAGPPSPYFSNGTQNEQNLLEDLIIQSLSFKGMEFRYVPRTLVSKDEILGEDRLSEFNDAFSIEMYFKNVDSYEGSGSFIQKFGLMIDQSATLTCARRRWEELIGRYGKTIIPDRPNEGDLLYFPMAKSLFEIKFVKHQNPFYQLNQLYVFDIEIQLFRYGSEDIETGDAEIDIFEDLATHEVIPETESTIDAQKSFGDNLEFKGEAIDFIVDTNNPLGDTDIATVVPALPDEGS